MSEEFTTKDYLSIDSDARELVDWVNPPSVTDLKNDLSEASSSHSKHRENVESWISALRGEVTFKPQKNRSNVQPKLVRKQNEWVYSSLEEPFLSTDDMFVVNPVTYQDVDAARQNMLVLNKQFRVDIPKVKFINKYIRTAVNTGTVIVKVHWESRVETVLDEVEEPVFTQSPEELYQFLQEAVSTGQMSEQDSIVLMQQGQPMQIGTEMVSQLVEKEVVNRPVLQVKDSRGIIIDPSCEGNIEKAQFIIDKFLTDMSTLKKDGRYANLEKIREKEYYSDTSDYMNDPNFKFQDKPRQKLIAYEYWGYWDINDDGMVKPIVATWVGDTLIRLEENPYPDKQLPFVVVQYLPPDNDTVYGDSAASLLKDNQDIIGAVSRSMIDLIGRSANAQQGIRKDLLDDTQLKAFKAGRDFMYNPVSNVGDALFTTKIPEIPRSALEMLQLQNNEAEAITGVKAFTGGITGDSLGSSVGGIRSALDATAKRELGILRRLSDGLKEVGKKIIAMNSVWLSDEEIIRITDDDFVAIKRSDLAGSFDLALGVSTAEADNQKASELAFMLQTTGNSLPFDITKILLSKIADLRKLPDLSRMITDYQPQPDPLVQEKAVLEIELLKAQIANESAKANENMVDVELKKAKTANEMAKAGKTRSEADLTDLNFVEQSSGLQQERELESKLLSAQSKNNASKPTQ